MKLYVEPKGRFAIKIPYDWFYVTDVYSEKIGNLQSFEKRPNKIGCFQISCNAKNKGIIPKLISTHNITNQNQGQTNLEFKSVFIEAGEMSVHMWLAMVNDEFIKIQYVFNRTIEKDEFKKEMERVQKVINSVIYIPENKRDEFKGHYHFDRFMTSLGACIDLQNRAAENESFIELIILIASQIDAQLRVSIILNSQLIGKNNTINLKLIYQSESDKPIMEKKIYDLALKNRILDKKQHQILYELYNERNKVVHRYIISELKTVHIRELVVKYIDIRDQIDGLLNKLEMRQFNEQIGLYKGEKSPCESMSDIALENLVERIKDKHANKIINKGITMGNTR